MVGGSGPRHPGDDPESPPSPHACCSAFFCVALPLLPGPHRFWSALGPEIAQGCRDKVSPASPGNSEPRAAEEEPGRLKLALLCPVICPSQSIHLSGGNRPSEGFQVVPGPSVPFEYLPSLSIRSSN